MIYFNLSSWGSSILSTQSSDTSQVTGAEQVLGSKAQITSFQFLLKWVVVVACCTYWWCGDGGDGGHVVRW